jgi:formiminoglutamase
VRLPFLLSVPHGGLRVPPEAERYCILTEEEIARDGDEGAAAVYALDSEVESLVRTDVARAIVDMNRAEDDRRKDGVVKTHTCWDVPVYDPTPPERVFQELIEHYHRPYHARLRDESVRDLALAIDCHTMAAVGPPVGPDPGQQRPAACLSNAGKTCPESWLRALAAALEETLEREVRRNDPFRGGYITRTYAELMPWAQLELSRGPFLSEAQKRERVLEAFRRFRSRVL